MDIFSTGLFFTVNFVFFGFCFVVEVYLYQFKIFFYVWGVVSFGKCAFYVLRSQTCRMLIVFGRFGWP